ncbi:DUF6799 domain-containing protein [Solirubrum puertoriconensis]|uniref:DUF6799 domain-containing protein n=1 Tax=Solirubrum puertoriconensis TaxID=1751427 RepID=A0A9X0HKB0_SOLP1|nr:DUF6799 domain-containing protein [Solirubrum puertoriconensis]KUG07499.1 hypothetical protein ASU33_14230 [Solirubrum puertoriconensis]
MGKLLLLSVGLFLLTAGSAVGQRTNNDGFQRRNGQMHVLRNGQLRPMQHDVVLPNGSIITKDGFVVSATGQRTELREGQGCDLKGNPVTVLSAANGLALASPGKSNKAREYAPSVEQVRAVLADFLGDDRDEANEYDRKQAEKAHERRKKEEEWLREEAKRHEEYQRERGKKWKEKRKERRDWDD